MEEIDRQSPVGSCDWNYTSSSGFEAGVFSLSKLAPIFDGSTIEHYEQRCAVTG